MCRLVLLVCALVAVLALPLTPAHLALADNVTPSAEAQLAAAKKAGKPAFLLVTDPKARGVDAVRTVLAAAQRQAPHVAIVEMDRSKAANKAIVKRYGLAGARAPFTLVIAHNGAPGGGVMPGKDAQAKLLALLPSPRKADTLLALFQRKAVFVVVHGPKMAGTKAAVSECGKAVAELKGKAAIVEVRLDDKAEKGFLKILGADPKAKGPVVHVYGLSGVKTGIVKGKVTFTELVKSARLKKQCCPTGECG